MPKIRPLEVQDVFTELARCPMGSPLYTDTGLAVIGVEPYGQNGPRLIVAEPSELFEKIGDIRNLVAAAIPGDQILVDLDIKWPTGNEWRKLLLDLKTTLDEIEQLIP